MAPIMIHEALPTRRYIFQANLAKYMPSIEQMASSLEKDQLPQHTIFKICLKCRYHTLGHPGLSIPAGKPNYMCSQCKGHTFVTACSVCDFQHTADCPLTLLLAGNPPKTENKTRKRSKEMKIITVSNLQAITERAEPISKEEEQQPFSTAETGQTSDTASFSVTKCNQCGHLKCQTCKPGYTKFIVDMKDFSKTFGDEIRLCTMCQHWLCPGSELVVIFRCRVCSHEGCERCLEGEEIKRGKLRNEDNSEDVVEQWYSCCRCVEVSKAEEVKKR